MPAEIHAREAQKRDLATLLPGACVGLTFGAVAGATYPLCRAYVNERE